jgi:hypothetical protein
MLGSRTRLEHWCSALSHDFQRKISQRLLSGDDGVSKAKAMAIIFNLGRMVMFDRHPLE